MYKQIILIIALLFPIVGQAAPLSEPASLRQFMPPEAIGYIRIPNPWGLANEQHQQQLQKLETAIHQNILVKGGELIHPLVTLLLHNLRSPLEAVVLLPEQTPPVFTNIVLSAKLNFSSIDEFNQFLKTLVAKVASLQIKNELSTDGNGLLIAGPLSIFLHYDLNSQRITMMTGLMLNPTLFQQTLAKFNGAAVKATKQHPMYEMENRIDTSHKGYFSWINLQKILPAIKANIPPATLLKLQKWGIWDFRAIALGCGTRDGKGRLSLIIDAPRTGYRKFFPAINNDISLTTSGKPGSVLSLSIPTLAWLKGFEKMLKADGNTDKLEEYQSFKQEFTQTFGFSLEDILAAFGPEILFFTDEAGEFIAVKTGDNSKLETIMKTLESKYGLTHETRNINGKIYHHLMVPDSLQEDFSATAESQKEVFWLEIISKLKSHYYWVEDEGYLIFATVPQPLFDRQSNIQRVPIQQWLTQEQRQNSQASWFLISTTLTNTPRYFYEIYLYSLEILNDIADANIDLFSLPSANTLKLPKNGTYGFQADASESLLSLEFTFENNPLEFILTPEIGMQVAIVGILAAVAIPAYTKYLERAKDLIKQSQKTDENISNAIAEATILLNSLKKPSEEFYAIFARLPDIKELEEIWTLETKGKYSNIGLLDTEDGYFAEFNDNSHLLGKLIITYDAESKSWTCTYENLPEQYLPKDCK